MPHSRCRPLLFHGSQPLVKKKKGSQLNPISIHAAATASQLYYIFVFLILHYEYLVIADVFKDIPIPIRTK